MPARSVMLVIADDWSPIAGCYGDPVIQTPNIDALAARGTRFDRAFCSSPSCAVSRATLLTGLHSHTHGQYGHTHGRHTFRTLPGTRSIPAVFKDMGYPAGCAGKTHVYPDALFPFTPFGGGGWSRTELQQQVTGFLEAAGDQPFYLHVAPMYPHRDGGGVGFFQDQMRDQFADVPTYRPDEIPVPGFLPDTPETRADLANYYHAVSRYDACVGDAIRALEASGRAKDTLVVVMTDHAMPFPGAKASSFDTGHRCPLVIARPDGQGGLASRAMVSWVDLAPTIYDWCNIPEDQRPDNLAGRSLLPILDKENPRGRDEVFFSHNFHGVHQHFPYRTIHTGKYKFTKHLAYQKYQPIPEDLDISPTWQSVLAGNLKMMGTRPTSRVIRRDYEELVDIENDPFETTNLIDDPALQDVANDLRQRLQTFRENTTDPLWLFAENQQHELAALSAAIGA